MKLSKTKIVVVGSAAAAVAMGIGPAFAGTPSTVAVGGSSAAGSHPISATTTSAGVAFAAGSATMSCTSSGVTSSSSNYVVSGTSVDPVANLGAVNFSGCTGPGGANTVTQVTTPWRLEAVSGMTAGSSDVISGYVTNVSARVSTTIPSVCTFTVSGRARATYNEATGVLTVNETGFTGNLTIGSVTGCGGNFAATDPADFSATYQIGTVDSAAFTAGKINVS